MEPNWEIVRPNASKKDGESWDMPTVRGEESAFPSYTAIVEDCNMNYYLIDMGI